MIPVAFTQRQGRQTKVGLHDYQKQPVSELLRSADDTQEKYQRKSRDSSEVDADKSGRILRRSPTTKNGNPDSNNRQTGGQSQYSGLIQSTHDFFNEPERKQQNPFSP